MVNASITRQQGFLIGSRKDRVGIVKRIAAA
jgi:hypothetical protein